jgi:hypothetical protein
MMTMTPHCAGCGGFYSRWFLKEENIRINHHGQRHGEGKEKTDCFTVHIEYLHSSAQIIPDNCEEIVLFACPNDVKRQR